jgi:hypothetical protein
LYLLFEIDDHFARDHFRRQRTLRAAVGSWVSLAPRSDGRP